MLASISSFCLFLLLLSHGCAQESVSSICGLTYNQTKELRHAFSIGNWLFVGTLTDYYALSVANDSKSQGKTKAVPNKIPIANIFPDLGDFKTIGAAVHFRSPIECTQKSDKCIQNLKTNDLVLVFSEDMIFYKAYRYNLTSLDTPGAGLTAITEASEMPWGLPPSGGWDKFSKAIGITSGQQSFTGLAFLTTGSLSKRSYLFLLSAFRPPGGGTDFIYQILSDLDAAFVDKRSSNMQFYQRIDMIAVLPRNKAYAFTHAPQRLVVRRLQFQFANLKPEFYGDKRSIKELFGCPLGSNETTQSDDEEFGTSTSMPTYKDEDDPTTSTTEKPRENKWIIWVIIGFVVVILILIILLVFCCIGSNSKAEEVPPKLPVAPRHHPEPDTKLVEPPASPREEDSVRSVLD